MPAILVEMGFISNPEQERQMTQPDFQTQVAEAIVAGVIRFRDHLATGPYEPDAATSGDGDDSAPAGGAPDARGRD